MGCDASVLVRLWIVLLSAMMCLLGGVVAVHVWMTLSVSFHDEKLL